MFTDTPLIDLAGFILIRVPYIILQAEEKSPQQSKSKQLPIPVVDLYHLLKAAQLGF